MSCTNKLEERYDMSHKCIYIIIYISNVCKNPLNHFPWDYIQTSAKVNYFTIYTISSLLRIKC